MPKAKKTKVTKVYRSRTPQAKPRLTGLQKASTDIGRSVGGLKFSSTSIIGGNPSFYRMISAGAKKDITKYAKRSGVKKVKGGSAGKTRKSTSRGFRGGRGGGGGSSGGWATIEGRRIPLS